MPLSAGDRGEDAPAASNYDFPVDLNNLSSTYGLLAAHIPRGATVLDVGCAGGNFAAALTRELESAVTAIDVDANAVAAARAQGIDAHLLDLEVATVTSLVAERRFDRVVLADVLEHLVEPQRVLREVRGLLSDGGRVLVSLPNVAHVDVALGLLEDRFEYRPAGLLDRTHLRFFTLQTFTELAAQCGFTVEAVERIELPVLGTEVLDYGREFTGDPQSAERIAEIAAAGNPNATTYQYVLVLDAVDNPEMPQRRERVSVIPGRLDVVVRTIAGRLTVLTDALYSLAALTWPDVHAIIVLHGTDDAYRAEIEQLLERLRGLLNAELVIADRPHSLRGYPLNVGLDAARGEFLAFCDDDDVLLPSFGDTLIEAMRSTPAVSLAYGAAIEARGRFDENGFVPSGKHRAAEPFIRARLFMGNWIAINSFVVRRQDLLSAGVRFDESLAFLEDWDMLCQLARKRDFVFVDEDVCEVRINENGNTLNAETNHHWHEVMSTINAKGNRLLVHVTGAELTSVYERYERQVEATARVEEARQAMQRALDNTNAKLEHSRSEVAAARAEVQYYATSRTQRGADWVRNHGLRTPMRLLGDLFDRQR